MSKKDVPKLSEVKNIPDQQLINHLKEALQEAETGELRAVAMVKLWDDEDVTHGWCISGREQHKLTSIIGRLFQLMTELSNCINGVHESNIKGDQ